MDQLTIDKWLRNARVEALREAAEMVHNTQLAEKALKENSIGTTNEDELDRAAFARGEFIMRNLRRDLLSRADAIEKDAP